VSKTERVVPPLAKRAEKERICANGGANPAKTVFPSFGGIFSIFIKWRN